MTVAASEIVTAEECEAFREQGLAGPYTAMTPDEMAIVRIRLAQEVFDHRPLPGFPLYQCRHLDSRLVWELCSNPAIVERMGAMFSPDLILWRSHFFTKPPGGKEIPWHQDVNYWPLEPLVNITAWLAITEVTLENSCLQFIPRSHKKILPHFPTNADLGFQERADLSQVDVSKAVNVTLKPGEFILFNERILHHSAANNSNQGRAALAIRVTIPIVKVYHDLLFPHHRCMVLRGEDHINLNRIARPPVEKNNKIGVFDLTEA